MTAKPMHYHRWPFLLLASCSAELLAAPTPEPGALMKQLDSIEVSAQKRAQPIAEVPVSVQVLDGEQLRAQNIKDTAALGGQVVNVKITQNTAEGTPPAISIRGVGNLDYNTSTTSPIGVYEDGVGGGTANRQLMNLYDVETIEVLRGPQGTLFGRNTTGGALLITTRKPDQEQGGYANAGFGSDALYKIGGAYNLPLSDRVAARLAFDDQRYDYTINNLYEPAPTPGMHQTEARLSLLADFEPLEIYVKAHAENWRGVSTPVRHIGVIQTLANPSTGQPAVLCAPQDAGSTRCTDIFGFNVGTNNLSDVSVNSDVNGGSPHRTQSWGSDLNVTYQLTPASFITSVSSFNSLEKQHFYNADASPASITEGSLQVDGELASQELRYHLQSNHAYFIAGVYLLNEPLTQDFFIDLFRDFRASPTLFSSATKILYNNRIDTQSRAAFANLDYHLSEATILTAGLRYTREKVDYRAVGRVNVATAVNDNIGTVLPAWDVSGRVKDGHLSGKVALNHKWTPHLNTWLSAARGFKSGGYNGGIAFSAEEAARNDYGSETLNALEAGGNWALPDYNAGLQVSLFYYDYQDQQVFMNTPSTQPNAPPLQLLDNVGESSIYGSELELTWQPLDSLQTRLGIGYLPKAELKEFAVAGGIVRGNRLPFTSRWNINGFLDYQLPLATGEVLFQLNGNYQSEFYFDQNQNPYTKQAGYSLWNGRVAYEQGNWSTAIWGKNLTDRGYSNLRFDLINFLGLVQDNRGAGRQFGLDFDVRF